MMKYFTAFILFFLSITAAVASGDSARIHLIKVNPMSLMDFDNTFNVAYEGFFMRNKSIQLEAGYGNTNFNVWMNDENKEYRGFTVVKLRSEYRQYRLDRLAKRPEGPYLAAEVFFKSVFKNDMINVGRGVINNTPQYWEFVEGTVRKNVYASHLKFGTQFYFLNDYMEKKRRLMMDIYAGLGFRVVQTGNSYQNKRPDDFQPRQTRRTFATITEGNQTIPYVSAVVGFKLGYLL